LDDSNIDNDGIPDNIEMERETDSLGEGLIGINEMDLKP